MRAPIVIVKTGSTFASISATHGDFERWITEGAGVDGTDVRVVDVVAGEPLPTPKETRAVIVTGSAAMVTDRAEWSERTAGWLQDAVARGTPTLAICYGHQLLAHALGGVVDNNPRGRQIGTVDVTFTEDAARDPLLGEFGTHAHLPVSHLQSVVRLPPGARLLGTAPRDPHHVFAYGTAAWGVQFHPEFNADIVRGYIRERDATLRDEGLDPDQLAAHATDTDHGPRLLQRFATLTR